MESSIENEMFFCPTYLNLICLWLLSNTIWAVTLLLMLNMKQKTRQDCSDIDD